LAPDGRYTKGYQAHGVHTMHHICCMLATLLQALSRVEWTFSPTSVDKRTASRLFDLVSMLLRLLCCLAQMFCCSFF